MASESERRQPASPPVFSRKSATNGEVVSRLGRTLARMRLLALAALLGLAVAGALQACSTSPAEQEAIRKAWAARDAERAAECRRHGVGFVAGGCATGGP